MSLAIVTVASKNVLPEVELLKLSVSLFVGCPVIVRYVENFDLKKVGYEKTAAIREALKEYDEVLYCDTDVIFLSDWQVIIPSAVTLSRHLIKEEIENKYGRYNSGYILLRKNGIEFLNWWDAQPHEQQEIGCYGDQQCLDRWPLDKRSLFNERHNVGWWRQVHGKEPFRLNPLPISVHTHILKLPGYTPNNTAGCQVFNRMLIDALKQSQDVRHKELLDTINGVSSFKIIEDGHTPVFSDGLPFAHSENFLRWLGKFIGKRAVGIEVGTWEGRSALWLLDNILTDKESSLNVVDTWQGEAAQKEAGCDFELKEKNFLHNIKPYGDKVVIHKGESWCELLGLRDTGLKIDFAYIDGDHSPSAVLVDGEYALAMLNIGGVIIFDDYEWSYKGIEPKIGIDYFLETYKDKIKVLYKGSQVAIEKIAE